MRTLLFYNIRNILTLTLRRSKVKVTKIRRVGAKKTNFYAIEQTKKIFLKKIKKVLD